MLIVQKYGGSSVADIDKIKKVAKKVIATKKKGNNVVVIVSAPGDTTDELIELAGKITDSPEEREMDMLLATGEQKSIALLSMAINSMGEEAISLTGPQVGIVTDTSHTKAKIKRIDTARLKQQLKKGKIVIVAGFQGSNAKDEITTLGRGGSDLTAVAIASVLKSDVCEIYTDVAGVYTADPRVIPEVRKINDISYDEMLEMAGSGTQVMQARSIEVARKFNVKLHIKPAFSNEKGTIVGKEVPMMEEVVVRGVSYDKNQAKMSITEVPDRPGIAAKIFGGLADRNINVNMIIQSYGTDGLNDISFTINRRDLKKGLKVMGDLKKSLKARQILCDDKVAEVSIIGVGMKSHPGVAAKMFRILGKEKINIQMISTSEIKISCVISEKDVGKTVRAIHKGFKLEKK